MLVSAKKIINSAVKSAYAVPALNCPNLEFVQAAAEAAAVCRSPVIIQVTENDAAYANLEALAHTVRSVAKREALDVPVALHLDHTQDEKVIKEAIRHGFSSVMIDASLLSFEENVKRTRKIVDYAHKRGVIVQGESGRMLEKEVRRKLADGKKFGKEDYEQFLTVPEEALEFVKRTGVDTLAIAIGNLHGTIKYVIKKPALDVKRLNEINSLLRVPLILHGGSSMSTKELKACIKAGIRVVNFRTDFFLAFTNSLRKELAAHPKQHDPRKYLLQPRLAAQKVIEKKMELLGSASKAKYI